MSKLLFLTLLGLSLALACHPSCNCIEGSNVCISCKYADEGAKIDSNKRSCPCPPGSFLTTLTPEYSCTKLSNTDENGHDISLIMDACKIEIGQNAQKVKIDTDCHFENVEGKSFVVSKATLNFNDFSISNYCKNAYVTSVQYKDYNSGEYIYVPSKYVTSGAQGSQELRFPLIDIYELSVSTNLGESQISQTVELKIFIGHQDAIVRIHKWNLYVFTNRDQVEVFTLDVNIQETEGCQPGQECIIIADLDTVGKIYQDSTYSTLKSNPLKYLVGDIFYAKITFADPTYTKYLKFQKLYFKNSSGKIFNFSSITTHQWSNNGLEFSLPLVEPTDQAVIQINMKIDPMSGGRFLVSNQNEVTTSKKFTVQVINDSANKTFNQANKDESNSNSMTLLFGLMNLALIFLY